MKRITRRGQVTFLQAKRRFEQQKGKCFWCNFPLRSNWQLDHVIPVIRGGPNGLDNLVASCKPCNIYKSGKLPWEWEQLIHGEWEMLKSVLDKWSEGRFSQIPILDRVPKPKVRLRAPKPPVDLQKKIETLRRLVYQRRAIFLEAGQNR